MGTSPDTEYISMGHHFTLFYEDGEYYVDTGHADVGPFETKHQAQDHIDQRIENYKQRTVSVV